MELVRGLTVGLKLNSSCIPVHVAKQPSVCLRTTFLTQRLFCIAPDNLCVVGGTNLPWMELCIRKRARGAVGLCFV
jgi:hypothetical protein